MDYQNLVLFAEGGGLINSTVITDESGTYRYFRVNHPPISTQTVSALNLQVAEFYKKFLLDSADLTQRVQLINEKGFTFYGIPSTNVSEWITITNLTVTSYIPGIPQLLVITLPESIPYTAGQLFRVQVVSKTSTIPNPLFKYLTGDYTASSDGYFLYPIVDTNRTSFRFVNPLNTILDITTEWGINVDIQIQFVGGMELHDFFNYSIWNQKDFNLQWENNPSEFVNRPFTPVGFPQLSDVFYSTGNKIYTSRNTYQLDINQMMDYIYGNSPNYTVSNSLVRVRLYDYTHTVGAGNSLCELVFSDPLSNSTAQYNGIICQTVPTIITYGDYIWLSVMGVTINNVFYNVTSKSIQQLVMVTAVTGNQLIFDRSLSNDFVVQPTATGQLPDPADFQAAIINGDLLFAFNVYNTVTFSYPAGMMGDFLANSLQFFNNLKTIEMIPYDVYIDITWPYVTIDPRGSYTNYVVSVDIQGDFIFGFVPTPLYPQIYTFTDFYPTITNAFPDCTINVLNSIFVEAWTDYNGITNVLPTSTSVLTNRLVIGNVQSDGTFAITLNGTVYTYTSIQNNTRNAVADWVAANSFYIQTQQDILVLLETGTDPAPVYLNIFSKFPSIDYTISIDPSYNVTTNIFIISSIDQFNFPSSFSLTLGEFTRGVDTTDLSTNFTYTSIEKSTIAFNRWVSAYATEMSQYGYTFNIISPNIIENLSGPIITEATLEIYQGQLMNPPIVGLSPVSKGWFVETNIINSATPYQAIQSSKLYRQIPGFPYTDMQIRPGDRVLLDGSIYKSNNTEMIVQGVFEQYLIVAVFGGGVFDGTLYYNDYYVNPGYIVDDYFDDNLNYPPITPMPDPVTVVYLLDRIFYPRGTDPTFTEYLTFSWETPETGGQVNKFFFVDLSGDSLFGCEPDRVQYTGRTPLYVPDVERKMYLIDTYNTVPSRADNPYFQQTEFQTLYRTLPPADNIAENWRNYPMSLILGYRSPDNYVHNNICDISIQKFVSMTITPSYLRGTGYIRGWDITGNVLTCNYANFPACGFYTSDPVSIQVSLSSNLVTGSTSPANFSWSGTVSDISTNTLTLTGITGLMDELGIDNIFSPPMLKSVYIEVLPKLVGKIEVWGEAEEQDNRLEIGMRNYGIPLRDSDFYAFREWPEWEWGMDYRVINRRRKDMLLNKREIWDYRGSYKAIINSVKYFGHPDISIWNWALNLDTTAPSYGNWQRIDLVQVGNAVGVTGWANIDKDQDPPLPTLRWQRNNWIHMVWPRTDSMGKFTNLYSERDEILQLGLLKRWEDNNVVPMYNKLLDISSWSQNPWNMWIYGELTKVHYMSFDSNSTSIGFYTESYLNPISENYSSWICSVRFDKQILPVNGFWLIIKTFVQENGWKGDKVVQVYQEYRRNLEAYNFVMDLNHDPYATIETIVEDPNTGLKAVTRHYIDITSRSTT